MEPQIIERVDAHDLPRRRSPVAMAGINERRGYVMIGRSSRFAGALVAVTAMLLSLGFVACGSSDDSSGGGDSGSVKKVDLYLPYQDSIAFIGELIAKDKGYFKDEGLEVKTIPTEGGAFVTQQLIGGKAKYGVNGAADVIVADSKRKDALTSIAQLDYNNILVVVAADSGVKTVQDLKGKSLGITDPGSGEVPLVKAMLAEAGLTDSVKLVTVGTGGPAAFNALKTGRIAAYSGYTNDMAAIQAEGLQITDILPAKYRGLPSNVLVATTDTLQNKGDLDTLIGIGKGWNRGTQFALDNPDEALTIACKMVPEECKDKKVAKLFLDVTLKTVKPRPPGAPYGKFNYSSLELMVSSLVKEAGAKNVDLQQVFTNKYIDQLQP